jgi:hypothetical protein
VAGDRLSRDPRPVWCRPERVPAAFGAVLSPAGGDDGDPGSLMRRPRTVALGILEDWWSMFVPEPGYDEYVDGDGRRVDVVAEMERQIVEPAELVACLEHGWGSYVEDGTIVVRESPRW